MRIGQEAPIDGSSTFVYMNAYDIGSRWSEIDSDGYLCLTVAASAFRKKTESGKKQQEEVTVRHQVSQACGVMIQVTAKGT